MYMYSTVHVQYMYSTIVLVSVFLLYTYSYTCIKNILVLFISLFCVGIEETRIFWQVWQDIQGGY